MCVSQDDRGNDDDEENNSGYCALDKPEYTARVRWIRRGFQKRVRDYLLMAMMMQKQQQQQQQHYDDDDDVSVVHRATVWESEPRQ